MDKLHRRCDGQVACVEVVARLVAADQAAATGYKAEAEQLRQNAERFARVHQEAERLLLEGRPAR